MIDISTKWHAAKWNCLHEKTIPKNNTSSLEITLENSNQNRSRLFWWVYSWEMQTKLHVALWNSHSPPKFLAARTKGVKKTPQAGCFGNWFDFFLLSVSLCWSFLNFWTGWTLWTCVCAMTINVNSISTLAMTTLNHGWANYGPRAKSGTVVFLIRAAEDCYTIKVQFHLDL